jgi:CrcB protein
MMDKIGWVMLGGALGAACRYAFSVGLSNPGAGGFPWATFVVNMLGCLLIGLVWRWLIVDTTSSILLPLIVTGFLGGFTTFSTFGLESFILWRSGETGTLMVYIMLSNILGFAFVVTGNKIGELIGK